MSENTIYHLDHIMIPDLEQMKKLYTAEEIADIIMKRKEFDKKIERTLKEKQDFLNYIKYEVSLIRSVIMRKSKQNLNVTKKNDKIEYSIAKRVIKLYKIALSYFKKDEKLWMSYINFCTNTRFNTNVSEAFLEMLQVHGDKVNLWREAARWELEKLNNPDSAINLLKSGLKRHTNAKELYLEAFKIELTRTTKYTNETERQKDAMKKAELLFKTSLITIQNDVEYVITLLEIVDEFDFAHDLQTKIVKYLRNNFWDKELMWHTMAQRELKGKKDQIRFCIAVYKTGVKILPTPLMWERYLDTLVDLYLNMKKSKDFVTQRLEEELEEAHQKEFLQEKHYTIWTEIVDKSKRLDILTKATNALPKSEKLWILCLQHHMVEDQIDELLTLAEKAIKSLKEKSIQIFKCLIHYYILKHNFEDVKIWYEKGIDHSPEISTILRPEYIEWLFFNKSIKHVRLEYERYAKLKPFCLGLHKKMLELEYIRLGSLSFEQIKSIHESACEQFGKEATDVWIDYVKFDKNHCNSQAVGTICYNAKVNLSKNLYDKFTVELTSLNIVLK